MRCFRRARSADRKAIRRLSDQAVGRRYPRLVIVGTGAEPAAELVGRSAETDRIDAIFNRLGRGGDALLIRGDPGIGKSALLHHAWLRADAAGIRSLVTTGVESEAELAFAGLHQLLQPILGIREMLPDRPRRVLEAAFCIAGDLEPDLFRVALAAHQLVCEAAESGPLILIVDDAHWLDQSSLGVLAFIARRLELEPVGFLAAARSGYATRLAEGGLPTIELERLSAEAAADLLDRGAPGLHPVVRARVLAAAAGNPLALVELARSLPPEAGIQSFPALPLTERLERAFTARLDELPAHTRACLLAAALDGRASLDEVVRCAATVAGNVVSVSAVDPAVEVGLVEIDAQELRFRHPLIRSALRQKATVAQRIATYAALAEVVVDPERKLWHRAMAAVGCDEDLAADLEDYADAAQRRGAMTVAAPTLERAAALTAEPRRKGKRLVRAAEVADELGLADVARRLVQQADSLELEPLETARLAWLRQTTSGDVWFEKGAARLFVSIAGQMLSGGDADMALRSLVPIAHRCWWTRTQNRTRRYLVDTAQGMGAADDDPRLLAVLAMAHPEVTGPSVLERISGIEPQELADPLGAMYVGIAAEKAGDFALGARLLGRAVNRLREQGRLGMLTQALVHYAWAATYSGDWGAAAAAAAEAARLAADTSQPQFGVTSQLLSAVVEGLRGRDAHLDEVLASPEQMLVATDSGPMLAPAHMARAASALGDGRHDDAFRQLWPIFDESAAEFHRFMRWPVVLDLVEAGVNSGNSGRLTGVLLDLEEVARRAQPPILVAGLASARPLLADDREAEALFAVALGQDPSGHQFLRARTLFSFGRWLRRRRRSAEARQPLRDAVALFDALGATRWSERARHELRATGERIGRRVPDARDRLTAQELQIAQLAAQGLTNREIGERLFLSHRTIGGHLYRIFPKLEIAGRAQLRDALLHATGES
jgi:DNA-binding CsgD family transcriptional regulator